MIDDVRLAMVLLLFSCVGFGAYASNVFAITQTLAGPGAAGQWTGVQNGFANLAGVAVGIEVRHIEAVCNTDPLFEHRRSTEQEQLARP